MRYKLMIQTNEAKKAEYDSSPNPERIYRLFEAMAEAPDVVLRQGDLFVCAGPGYRSRVWIDVESGLFGGEG